MSARIIPTAIGAVVFATLVGLFGYSLELDTKQTVPTQSPASQWETEKSALLQAHSRDITKFTISLDAANQQVTTLTAQRKAACDRLAKAGISLTECR